MIRIKEFSTFIFRCWCRLGLFFQSTNGKGWWSMITSLWGQPTTPQPCGCSLGVVDQLSNSSKATSFDNSQFKKESMGRRSQECQGHLWRLQGGCLWWCLAWPWHAVAGRCLLSYLWSLPHSERDGGRCWKTQDIGDMIDNNRQVECESCTSRLYVLVLVMSLLVLLLLLSSSSTFVWSSNYRPNSPSICQITPPPQILILERRIWVWPQ